MAACRKFVKVLAANVYGHSRAKAARPYSILINLRPHNADVAGLSNAKCVCLRFSQSLTRLSGDASEPYDRPSAVGLVEFDLCGRVFVRVLCDRVSRSLFVTRCRFQFHERHSASSQHRDLSAYRLGENDVNRANPLLLRKNSPDE